MIKWLLATPPEVGSVWRFFDELHNPFKKPDAVVTDVKNGFVKYRWFWSTDGAYGSSCSIRAFRAIFRRDRFYV